jgi:hypothetical protein
MPFAQHQLRATFRLTNGVFEGGGNSLTLSYPTRMSAQIVNAGAPSLAQIELSVYGMSLSDMNQLTSLGTQINLISANELLLEAGDVGGQLSKVFEGSLVYAWADLAGTPDAIFRVIGAPGAFHKVAPAPSTSINGSADVATLMQGFASQMGLSFENNGVTAKIASPYYWGSLMNQAQACAQAAGIEMDVSNGTLSIWPTGSSRSGSAIDISPTTGMIGYPVFNQAGIAVRTLFNPSLLRGRKINVASEITPACGIWIVYNFELNLESVIPNGNWYAEMSASRVGVPPQQP